MPVEVPFKAPEKLDSMGLPEGLEHYRTSHVARVLGISPDLMRHRFRVGKYPEVKHDAKGRLFTKSDVQAMLSLGGIGRSTETAKTA